jgi:hypothetical protein
MSQFADLQQDKGEDHYEQVYNNDNFEENKASFTHEAIAGGAAFAGFKAFEDHQRKEGTWAQSTAGDAITDATYRQARLPPVR